MNLRVNRCDPHSSDPALSLGCPCNETVAFSASYLQRMQTRAEAFQLNRDIEINLAIEKSRDQRKFGRRPVFKAAVIVFDDGQRLPCTILDLSEGGAKVKTPTPESLKGEFYLEVPSDDLVIRCQLAYVEAGAAGVKYVKPPRRLSWLKR
jgi:PilZ domain